MKPHFQARDKATTTIEGFWYQSLASHPSLIEFVEDEDTQHALSALLNISFDELEDNDGFTMTFVWSNSVIIYPLHFICVWRNSVPILILKTKN